MRKTKRKPPFRHAGSRAYLDAGPMRERLWENVSRAVVIRPFTAKEYAESAKDPRPRPVTYYDGTPVFAYGVVPMTYTEGV